jgi:hypothetical protein
MTLKAVPGGWINTDFENEYQIVKPMITQERKSKYKHKVIISGSNSRNSFNEIRDWCEQSFGPGGRSRKLRWRFGWTDKNDTYYFKSSKDAMLFTLRWSDAG